MFRHHQHQSVANITLIPSQTNKQYNKNPNFTINKQTNKQYNKNPNFTINKQTNKQYNKNSNFTINKQKVAKTKNLTYTPSPIYS